MKPEIFTHDFSFGRESENAIQRAITLFVKVRDRFNEQHFDREVDTSSCDGECDS